MRAARGCHEMPRLGIPCWRQFQFEPRNTTFPFRLSFLSAVASRTHRVSRSSHLNLNPRSNHCDYVQMHLSHVVVAPRPSQASSTRGNVRCTVLYESDRGPSLNTYSHGLETPAGCVPRLCTDCGLAQAPAKIGCEGATPWAAWLPAPGLLRSSPADVWVTSD